MCVFSNKKIFFNEISIFSRVLLEVSNVKKRRKKISTFGFIEIWKKFRKHFIDDKLNDGVIVMVVCGGVWWNFVYYY